jgi:hypothetical protein
MKAAVQSRYGHEFRPIMKGGMPGYLRGRLDRAAVV